MKKLLILLFSLLISFNSYGEWTQVSKDINNNTYYIDYKKIKKIDGYHYFWWMTNLLKPDMYGDLSYIGYVQGDCKLSRKMNLSEFYYTLPNGEGSLTTNNVINPVWAYNPIDSVNENVLEEVCNYAD